MIENSLIIIHVSVSACQHPHVLRQQQSLRTALTRQVSSSKENIAFIFTNFSFDTVNDFLHLDSDPFLFRNRVFHQSIINMESLSRQLHKALNQYWEDSQASIDTLKHIATNLIIEGFLIE